MPVFRRWPRAFVKQWMQIHTSVPGCYYNSELWEELMLQASSSTLLPSALRASPGYMVQIELLLESHCSKMGVLSR